MERTRLRELTQNSCAINRNSLSIVEMERTRLRELTPLRQRKRAQRKRLAVEMERTRLRELTHTTTIFYPLPFRGRNGAYPIKGIDTTLLGQLWLSYLCVEMERTRLRELTHVITPQSTSENSA